MPTSPDNQSIQTAAIILAAGKGTRMGGDLPKVLHEVAGRPMVHWVIDAARAANATPIILVVGYREDLVRTACADMDVTFVTQAEQLGTGHAVAVCEHALTGHSGDTLVLAGDGPLIRTEVLHQLIDTHRDTEAAATLATAELDDPTGYGRIVRDDEGQFDRIVEHKNATKTQLGITEVYPSYAVFDTAALFADLKVLPRNEVSGEYYLTAVPERLREQGRTVSLVHGVPAEDILSINTPEQRAAVDAVLRNRAGMEPCS
jgi:UDP-N-acetylglucosamine diphosphorylase/glucosamine-1-phosphate N-acetyltransferase